MKTAWRELDGRLGKQEMFRENFIRESIMEKSQRSVDKLLRGEVFGAVVVMSLIPLMLWSYGLSGMPVVKTFYMALISICLLITVWMIVKMSVLFKMDISHNLKDNIRRIRRFELYITYEKRGMLIFVPILFLAGFAVYATIGVPAWLWAFMAVVDAIGIMTCIYSYKKYYAKHIEQITHGLEELRDLKEGDE